MDPNIDISYSQFKILFINIFIILHKAATLNLKKLQLDLREITFALHNSCPVLWMPKILIPLISLLVLVKFLFGYLSIAANIVAIFPILTDDQPELLLPSIISQAIENLLLSIFEIAFGYVAVKYIVPSRPPIFLLFLITMIVKITLSVSTLNVYSEFYNKLRYPILYTSSEESLTESSEKLLKKEILM